jgi:hypothetical protein
VPDTLEPLEEVELLELLELLELPGPLDAVVVGGDESGDG